MIAATSDLLFAATAGWLLLMFASIFGLFGLGLRVGFEPVVTFYTKNVGVVSKPIADFILRRTQHRGRSWVLFSISLALALGGYSYILTGSYGIVLGSLIFGLGVGPKIWENHDPKETTKFVDVIVGMGAGVPSLLAAFSFVLISQPSWAFGMTSYTITALFYPAFTIYDKPAKQESKAEAAEIVPVS